MAIIDALVLLSLLGGVSAFARRLFMNSREKRNSRDKQFEMMHSDLKEALQSRDYKRLEDFMVMWGSKVEPTALIIIKQRRDELYLESDKAST
jgi:hypothetical protein